MKLRGDTCAVVVLGVVVGSYMCMMFPAGDLSFLGSRISPTLDGSALAATVPNIMAHNACDDAVRCERRADAVQRLIRSRAAPRLLEAGMGARVLPTDTETGLGPGPVLVLMRHATGRHNVLMRHPERSVSAPYSMRSVLCHSEPPAASLPVTLPPAASLTVPWRVVAHRARLSASSTHTSTIPSGFDR
jgi:hypothetical protein